MGADSIATRIKERWLMILFGLPFAAIGVGTLIWGVGASLVSWQEMKTWQPVQAELLETELKRSTSDDSITYKVSAIYRYSFNGRTYTGTRVGIGDSYDNVGDYHQLEAGRLKRALERGQTVTAWVNPDRPDQAVLNRDLRWAKLGFFMIFVVAFGSVGGGIILYCLLAPSKMIHRKPGEASASDQPWLEWRDWASAEIKSDGKAGMYISWAVAVVWNSIALPAGIIGVREALAGNLIALVALLFPLVGLALVWWAISLTLNWRRFGPAPLHLDPYPGSVGGQVGGTIDVRLPYSMDNRFEVSLKCLRSYVSGSGKNRSRRESLVWQSEGVAQTEASAKGTRLKILFDVDDKLPTSERPSNSYHLWRLDVHCPLPGTDFSRTYEIPVFATGQKAQTLTELSTENRLVQQAREDALEAILDIQQIPGGVILHYPALRHPGGKITLILVGMIFSGVGMLVPADDFPSWIFTLIGLPMALLGFYFLLTSLDVRIDQNELITRRRFLGLSLGNRRYRRADIRSLSLRESYSSQSGKSHTTYYKIVANRHEGKPVTIGINLAGRDVAKQALESLCLLTGMTADEKH